MAYRLILDSPTDEITHVDEIFEGTDAALCSYMGDLWNRYAAHKPDRGFRFRAREIIKPATDRAKEKRGRIYFEISG